VIAVDSNILIYAHRQDSPWHARAQARVRDLAEDVGAWALPWPSLHEFVAIVTHPRIFSPPSTLDQALDQVAAWLGSPNVVLLAETADYWTSLRGVLESSRVIGAKVHDARIAALCASHGVRELWSADRDFSAFSRAITVRNPLVD
jgi:toxin-antitoxin system PIN domain toxin